MNTIKQLEKLTPVDYEQIGRMATVKMPDLVKEIREKYTPALKDLKYIPEICDRAAMYMPFVDQFDRYVLIMASVYSLYAPVTFIGCGNAPAGMRKAVSDVLGYKNGTHMNYYHKIACAYMKNPRYVKVVESIIAEFKPKSHDI